MDGVVVTINGKARTATTGTRLSDLTDLALPLPCGGHGKCGKCKVKASGALSPISAVEAERLTKEEINAGIRLACCTEIWGACSVESLSKEKKNDAVLTDGKLSNKRLAPSFSTLGVAIDIGTTTLAAKLLTPNGTILAECGRSNPQTTFGADVISRIESSLAGNSAALSETLVSSLDSMICQLTFEAKADPHNIDGIVMTGNTAMLYLLTKTSPEPLSHSPFEMTRGFGETLFASVLGLSSVNAETEVYLPPCISAFVGADTVCALLSADICAFDQPVMLADIGTNGEMALWQNKSLTVCSTAAGPAFEGVGISMGMCGSDGAIDKVTLENGSLQSHVIGNITPMGICGSGLVDAVAALLENETLDETGYMEEEEAEIAYPVVLTKRDIRMLQLAKSAICAGLQTLLHNAKLKESQIEHLIIAGGFGNVLNKESAGKIGLLPNELVPKVSCVGNAALSGAVMLLLDRSLRADAEKLAANAKTVDLSADPFFSEAYMLGMTFPETD